MDMLIATEADVLVIDPANGSLRRAEGLDGHWPTCLATDRWQLGRAWCGTRVSGVLRSEDGGLSWRLVGLEGERIMSVAVSPTAPDLLWVGTEPSRVWRSHDAGGSWEATTGLEELPSSDEWAFPPRPDTHHVRWIACHPERPGCLWVAIEAGALVTSVDGGRTWRDRAPGGPRDTHEVAVHPRAPDHVRVAAGDGYFESADAGATWAAPSQGLNVGYLRSVAIDPGDPEVVVVSAASRARSAYVRGKSDGRLYRREGMGAWRRIVEGWPDPPSTIAPLIRPGRGEHILWAADERGVHVSEDGGQRWDQVAAFERAPHNLRGFSLVEVNEEKSL